MCRGAGARIRLRGGGGVAPRAQTFTGSGSAADPSNVLTSYAVSGLFTRFTLKNPSTVSALPNTGVSFSVPLKDVLGRVREMSHGDLIRVGLWLEDAALPDDVCVGVVLTDGPLSATSYGYGIRVRRVVADAGHRVAHLINTGTSWGATEPAQSSASTRGAYATLVGRTQSSIVNVGAVPLDAAGLPIAGGNTGTTPAAMTGWQSSTHPDTVTFFAGWATGTGGSGGAVAKVRPVIALLQISDLVGAGL